MKRRYFLRLAGTCAAVPTLLSVRTPPPDPETPGYDVIEGGAAIFKEWGVEGSFVIRDLQTGRLSVINPSLMDTAFLPASTFKVPNTLIALDTGVVPDTSFALEWDGVERDIGVWNKSHEIRSAFRYSVFWFYQELARRIGEDNFRSYLRNFNYGNQDLSGGIDQFWLAGGLRISPIGQITFLEFLLAENLRVKPGSTQTLIELMPKTSSGDVTVFAKTGLAEQQPNKLGWLVGWIEDPAPRYVFASLCLGPAGDSSDETPVWPARAGLPLRILKHAGYLSEDFPRLG